MSQTGKKIPYAEASAIAGEVVKRLVPVVARMVVVGSVRRRRPVVGDIEVLVEPRRVNGLLGPTEKPDTEIVRLTAGAMGSLVRGGERYMQVRNVFGGGVTLEVYLCHPPAQWGSLKLIRTGPKEFSELVMKLLIGKGYRHRFGRVVTDNETAAVVPTLTEGDVFKLIGRPYLAAAQRDGVKPLGKDGWRWP